MTHNYNYNYSKDELLNIFDDITIISINNNLFIKDKVKKENRIN